MADNIFHIRCHWLKHRSTEGTSHFLRGMQGAVDARAVCTLLLPARVTESSVSPPLCCRLSFRKRKQKSAIFQREASILVGRVFVEDY